MKKTYALIGTLALVLALAATASAQAKIGVVNSPEILEKSAEGKRVLARLQDADKQNQTKVAALDDQIRRIQTELSTQRITMTDEAILQKSADLERKNTERKRVAEDAYASMNEMSQRLLGKLQSELIPIVEQLGKEKGLDIVFDLKNSGAVYWNPTVDLTAEVIKRYDASKAAGK